MAEPIRRLSEAFELLPGDIIHRGMPENVGPWRAATLVEAHIDKPPARGRRPSGRVARRAAVQTPALEPPPGTET